MSSATESDWETDWSWTVLITLDSQTESSDSSQRSDSEGPEPHQEISTPDDDISKVTYHPDGRRVISRADDGTIRVGNLEDGEQEGTSIEHESIIVDSLSVTSDGTRIIGGDENGCIRVWDVESHEVVQEWTHPESFCEIAISPDDQLIAVGSWMVFIYTMGGTQVNHSIKVGKTIWCISFSPNSGKLACGTRSDVYVYDVDDGTLILGPLQGHEHCVRCVLWSRDGSRLFSGSDDETIRCWNTDTGEQIGRLWTGHTNCILSLSLSPDGSILASASSDETVRFWDSTSGHVIGQDLQHDDDVNAVSFSPSGEFVASATGDGTIYLWPVPRLDSRLDSVESSERHTTNINSILPDLSLGHDERQRIFEVRLRKVV
ncbi:WD40 repeat-like protein [Imleria badia]|nr:WD40 repeat-like protein [Imleria badia]